MGMMATCVTPTARIDAVGDLMIAPVAVEAVLHTAASETSLQVIAEDATRLTGEIARLAAIFDRILVTRD